MTFRVGGSWKTTIIEVGVGEPDERGRREDDRLAAVTMNRPGLAQRIVDGLNGVLIPPGTEDLAADVLVAHQRRDNGGPCICGWNELGRSHAMHKVEMLKAARRP